MKCGTPQVRTDDSIDLENLQKGASPCLRGDKALSTSQDKGLTRRNWEADELAKIVHPC